VLNTSLLPLRSLPSAWQAGHVESQYLHRFYYALCIIQQDIKFLRSEVATLTRLGYLPVMSHAAAHLPSLAANLQAHQLSDCLK
jgi:hypothetical protein